MRLVTALAASISLALFAPCLAAGPDSEKGRYTMQSVDGGLLRLDTQTGAMALCSKQDAKWACTAIDESGKQDREKIAPIEAENLELKERVRVLEKSLETKAPAEAPPGGDNKMQLPTEQEVDQALDYVERIFKKFRERLQKIDPPATKPNADGGAL